MSVQNNYTYQILNSQFGTAIQRIQDGAFIPNDSNNLDYQNYMSWVAVGNTATPITLASTASATYATATSLAAAVAELQTQITTLQNKIISVNL